jgi:hypothetical protein
LPGCCRLLLLMDVLLLRMMLRLLQMQMRLLRLRLRLRLLTTTRHRVQPHVLRKLRAPLSQGRLLLGER